MAVSSARCRISLSASLLLEGDPSRDDEEARESCSSSDESRRRVASSSNAAQMLVVLVDLWMELLRRTARDATEWSLPVCEGATSNTVVVYVLRSSACNCDAA